MMLSKLLNGIKKMGYSKQVNEIQKYLLALNEGLGTTYERYALNHFTFRFGKKLGIKTVCEIPANGVMGVPGIKSLGFAVAGVEVTLVNSEKEIMKKIKLLWQTLGLKAKFIVTNPQETNFSANSFDLVWNFCVFEHLNRPEDLVREMVRISRKYVLIQTQNVLNPGNWFHFIYHQVRGEEWDHGSLRRMFWRRVEKTLKRNGLEIIERSGTDLPPWFDINMKLRKEKGIFWGREFFRPKVRVLPIREIVKRWQRPVSFPWWMNFLRIWYKTIEIPAPKIFKLLFSHHPYILAQKND